MTTTKQTPREASAVTRTGLLLAMIKKLSFDLTGQDLGDLFDACLGVKTQLRELIFLPGEGEAETEDAFIVRILECGRAVGVVHGATRLVLLLDEGPEVGELAALSAAIGAFQTAVSSSGANPRLLLQLHEGSSPQWPIQFAVKSDDEWHEVRLADPRPPSRGHTATPGIPPHQIIH